VKKEFKLGELLERVQPEDLLKFGLIPEFIGRLPGAGPPARAERRSTCDILTKPKNSLVKQFQKLFEMDGVKLKFTKGSLVGVAREALSRNSGARGLRAILEHAMLDIMYDVPAGRHQGSRHQRRRDHETRAAAHRLPKEAELA